jgi:hypothetical protein
MYVQIDSSSFLGEDYGDLCPVERIFGHQVSFLNTSVYRPWENENQEQPVSVIRDWNTKAKNLFQTEAMQQALDIGLVIRKLDQLPPGTKLRMMHKNIDAVLQIEETGKHKKIRLLFTKSGDWKVSCFARIEIRLLKSGNYPSWLSLEQQILYRKLRHIYRRAKPQT